LFSEEAGLHVAVTNAVGISTSMHIGTRYELICGAFCTDNDLT
jgi:hypothetical protein